MVILMADLFDQYAHQRPNVNPTIYVYKDRAFPGYLKVGYTGRTAQTGLRKRSIIERMVVVNIVVHLNQFKIETMEENFMHMNLFIRLFRS